MTTPVADVPCHGPCGRVIYQGGAIAGGQVAEVPIGREVEDRNGVTFVLDAPMMLTDFALSSCPLRVPPPAECPNTPEAIEERDEQQPIRLLMALRALRDARVRGAAVALPALTAGAPVEVTVTWPAPLPDAVYRIAVTPVHGAAQLAAGLRWCLKPGSLTPSACVLIVAATQAVPAGAAGLHVVAAP